MPALVIEPQGTSSLDIDGERLEFDIDGEIGFLDDALVDRVRATTPESSTPIWDSPFEQDWLDLNQVGADSRSSPSPTASAPSSPPH